MYIYLCSSYGLLFSHVETILVMVSKESLALSGELGMLCLFLLAGKIMLGVKKLRWHFFQMKNSCLF